ncbi:MAG: DMT family transporter [Melioribacteraceae bacterium]|nr:DMT family transporter [Melioribacteraceae bacterium]
MNFRYSDHKALPFILLFLLGIIWGSSFILIKKGLEVFPPLQVGTIRIFFAYIVILPIALIKLRAYFAKEWRKFLIVGLLGNFFPAILFAVAETGLSSSLAGILNALTPIFTLIVGVMAFSAKINKYQTTGLFFGFIGSGALSFIGSGGNFGTFNYYALFVIAATLLYGININLLKKYFPHLNSIILTSLAMFTIGPLAIIYLLFSDFFVILSTNESAPLALLYLFILGAVGTSLALVLFNKLIQITTPVFASTVTYIIPIAAVLWGIIDGEFLSIAHFAGMALIISGVYIVNKNK